MTNYIEYDEDYDVLEVISVAGDFDLFIASTLHTDFQTAIDLRIEMLNTMLSDPKLIHSGRDYDVFRGGLRMAEEVRNMFTDIRDGFINVEKESIKDED